MGNDREAEDGRTRLPSPARVLQLIEHWRSLDLPRLSHDEIGAALRELIDGLSSMTVIKREVQGTRTIYRGRIKRRKNEANDKDWPWRNVQHLLHPTGPTVRLNRCNREKEPALYCGDKLATALREIQTKEGDEVVLIGYDMSNIKLALIPGPFIPSPVDSDAPIYDGEELISYQLVRDFIRSEFTKPAGKEAQHSYRVSAAICREWFDASVHGWVYPSVETPARECLAFRATSVEKHIFIKGASLARVFAVDGRCFAVETLRQATIHSDGSVQWTERDRKAQWICDCDKPNHVAPTPTRPSSRFAWLMSRFRRIR